MKFVELSDYEFSRLHCTLGNIKGMQFICWSLQVIVQLIRFSGC
jgi:hypothetical protein